MSCTTYIVNVQDKATLILWTLSKNNCMVLSFRTVCQVSQCLSLWLQWNHEVANHAVYLHGCILSWLNWLLGQHSCVMNNVYISCYFNVNIVIPSSLEAGMVINWLLTSSFQYCFGLFVKYVIIYDSCYFNVNVVIPSSLETGMVINWLLTSSFQYCFGLFVKYVIIIACLKSDI